MALTKVDDRGLKTPIDLQDNEKIRLGTGNDLELYSDGTTSFLKSDDLRLRSTGDEAMLRCIGNGAVELYHNGSKKLETTSYGTAVSGILTSTGDIKTGNDTAKFVSGASDDLQIYHDGSNSYVQDAGAGNLVLKGSEVVIQSGNSTETKAVFNNDGAAELYYNNVKKLATTATGIKLDDSTRIGLGANEDLQIYHDGSNSYIADEGVGGITISSGVLSFKNQARDETHATMTVNGAVDLYYDNVKSFATTSTGAEVLDGDTTVAFGLVTSNGYSGYLVGLSNDTVLIQSGTGENMAGFNKDGSADLYHDGNKKFETVSDGVNINGASFDTHLKFLGNKFLGRARWGYSTGYSGVTLGRTDTSFNSTIFMGVDTTGNSSGAFTGDGREIVFRNNHKFVIPNAANNNYLTSIALNGGAATEGVPKFPQGVLVGNNTANANILTDYEEGTWTPTVAGGGGTINSVYKAIYTKIGRLVHVQCYVDYTAGSSANAFQMGGLPFTCQQYNYSSQVVDFGRGGKKGRYSRTHTANSYLEFLYSSEATGSDRITLKGNQIGSGYIILSATYMN